MSNNLFNTHDKELATEWLAHPQYAKYTEAQKEYFVSKLCFDVRVQNPDEYEEPRLEFSSSEIYKGMIERKRR